MEYDVVLAHINKAVIGPSGIVEPLCNSCMSPDCSNPIREKTVYMVGIPTKMRLYVSGNVAKQVTDCRGYVGDEHAPMAGDPRPL